MKINVALVSCQFAISLLAVTSSCHTCLTHAAAGTAVTRRTRATLVEEEDFGRVVRSRRLGRRRRRHLEMTRTLAGTGTGTDSNTTITIPAQVPPNRTCGQIINTVTLAQIRVLSGSLLESFFPSEFVGIGQQVLGSLFQYAVQAQVVCASCQEIMTLYEEQGASFLNQDNGDDNDQGRFSFQSYCGADKFASNVTYSALLLIPVHDESQKPVAGTLKSHLAMPSFSFGEQSGAPSEYWLENFNFSALENNNSTTTTTTTTEEEQDQVFSQLSSFGDGLISLIKASIGVVVMAPDYLGYGQSYQSSKGDGIFDFYQQAAAVTFLKSKSIIESSSSSGTDGGCSSTTTTRLSKQSSASGYSLGGASVIAGALAWQGLGQEIVNVDSGGAPFRPSFQLAFAMDQMDNDNTSTWTFGNKLVAAQTTVAATSLSSKIPGLPNSNVGQNLIHEDWVDVLVELADSSPTMELLDQILPHPASQIFTTAMLEKNRVSLMPYRIRCYYCFVLDCVSRTD